MLFFTDYTTKVSRFLCHPITKGGLDELRRYKKIEYLIDPRVSELKKNDEYSQIELLHSIVNKLRDNEYISIDYPSDMQPASEDLFIEKSIKNNLRYKDNPQYIATIQSKFRNSRDFMRQFDYLSEEIDFSRKMVGLGNLCRIRGYKGYPTEIMEFLYKRLRTMNIKRLHIYGIGAYQIQKFMLSLMSANHNTEISVDSVKWTKQDDNCIERMPVKRKNNNPNSRHKYLIQCSKDNRNLFFLWYMKKFMLFHKIPVYF